MTKPMLFLDVDGVLNAVTRKTPSSWDDWKETTVLGYRILYSPSVVSFLNALSHTVDIVWLSTWRNRANVDLAPALGLEGPWVVAEDLVRPGMRVEELLPGTTRYPWEMSWHKYQVLLSVLAKSDPDVVFAWVDDDLDKKHKVALKRTFVAQALIIKPYQAVALEPSHLARLATHFGLLGNSDNL